VSQFVCEAFVAFFHIKKSGTSFKRMSSAMVIRENVFLGEKETLKVKSSVLEMKIS
jgi:hypothetical protein